MHNSEYDYLSNNKAIISGQILTEPVLSHELYGEGFYEFVVGIPRLSSHLDRVPMTVSERLVNREEIAIGKAFAAKGQFRSYNKLDGSKSKLMLSFFAREIMPPESAESPNNIQLFGFVCKSPVFRTTPFMREICDVLLAVNRAYNKSDYLPCIAWGRNARFLERADVGEKLFIEGRIQSREYTKRLDDNRSELRTAYEISVSKVLPAAEIKDKDEVTTSAHQASVC